MNKNAWINYELDRGVKIEELWVPFYPEDCSDGPSEPRKSYLVYSNEHHGFLLVNYESIWHGCLYNESQVFDSEDECWGYCNKFNSIELP